MDPDADSNNPFLFNLDLSISSSLQCRPLNYALRCLEMFKYVPLWYFTREGLAEAASIIHIVDEKTEPLTIAQEDEGSVTLKPAHAVGLSKNARLDALLSFTDFLFVKNVFLHCIEEAKWGNVVVDLFNWFFHRLKVHNLQQEGKCSERALVHYTTHICQDWHDKIT
ncbi:hypothetical protein J3A83DRAFT_470327 [Scleroderma citrinum]